MSFSTSEYQFFAMAHPDHSSLIFSEFEIASAGHGEVNAALLATARMAFPDSDIHFFAAKTQIATVEGLLTAQGISDICYHCLFSLPERGRIYLLICEWYLFMKLFVYAKLLRAQRLTLCSCRRRRLRWAHLLAAVNNGLQVVVIMHETLHSLALSGEKSRLEPLFRLRPFQSNHGNLVYLVLGSSIAYHTRLAFPSVAPLVRWMHHPYFFPADLQSKSLNGTPIVFCFYGVAKKFKGAQHFKELAKNIKNSEVGARAEFLFLGRFRKEALRMDDVENIRIPENDGEFTRSEMQQLSQEAHYAIFPYDQKEYTYRSSGTLFDAMAYGTPIIALKNPFFEHYFEEFGDIGYLCDSVKEMEKIITGILQNPPVKRYLQQQICLAQARSRLHYRNLARDFRQLPS